MPSRAAQERLSAREDFHGQPHGREQSPEGIAKRPVIVDDEDDRALGAHRIPGRAKSNVAPWPGFGVAQSRPPSVVTRVTCASSSRAWCRIVERVQFPLRDAPRLGSLGLRRSVPAGGSDAHASSQTSLPTDVLMAASQTALRYRVSENPIA